MPKKYNSIVHHHFDEVFLVNLEREKNKRINTYVMLQKFGIKAKLWSATDGYSKNLIKEFDEYKKRPLGQLRSKEHSELEVLRGKGFIESPGAWGYIKTYESIIQYSLDRGLNRILILEDDVILHNFFELMFCKFMSRIERSWKVILLGASQYNWGSFRHQAECYYHPKIIHTCGSFALGLDRSVMRELLESLSYRESPFDLLPLGGLYERYSKDCFVAFPTLIAPDVSESTIRGQRDQEKHSKKMRWAMNSFRFPTKKPLITVVAHQASQIEDLIENPKLAEFFRLNYSYCIDGAVRPVHSAGSPSLLIEGASQSELSTEAKERLLYQNPSDAIVCLERNTTLRPEEIAIQLQQAVIEGKNIFDGFEILQNRLLSENLKRPPPSALVSIIIPTYKRSLNLRDAINSALNQTYKNIEVIVVDDNNPNSMARLDVENLMVEYSGVTRLIYIQHPKNLNGSAARNTGIMSSSGEFVCFLDDDDTYFPEKIQLCVHRLRQLGSGYGGVYGGFVGWNSKIEDETRYKLGDLSLDILTLSYKNHYLHTNTALYRREAILNINGFDDSFVRHQDLEFNLRYFQHYKIGVVKRLVAHLKPVPPSNSNKIFGDKFFETKVRYLANFKDTISTFSDEQQREIYKKNWNEVKRYYDSETDFHAKCLRSDESGVSLISN